MADTIFIPDLPEIASVTDNTVFVADDGITTSSVKGSKIVEYIKNVGDIGSVKSVNEVFPDETGNITLTAEDIGASGNDGNINSFSSLSQLDLTDDNFLEDNFHTNAQAIFEALPENSVLATAIETSNLSKSVLAQLKTDLNATISSTVSLTLIFEKTTTTFPTNITAIINSRTLSYMYACLLYYNETDGYLFTTFVNSFRPGGFLPLSAGSLYALTNSLFIKKDSSPYIRITENTNNSAVAIYNRGHAATLEVHNAAGSTTNRRYVMIRDSGYSDPDVIENSLVFVDAVSGTSKTYNVFGEHNKPIGSYEGSGSTASRTIEIGGIGNLLIITSNYGMAWVTQSGAITKTTSGTTLNTLAASAVKFVDGVLTIASNSSYVNSSSYEYSYQVV